MNKEIELKLSRDQASNSTRLLRSLFEKFLSLYRGCWRNALGVKQSPRFSFAGMRVSARLTGLVRPND
ncbi:MAG: hypothetical protein CTY36_03090 [Methylocystis sp.]|nr:MAG: hypothetical protein CTY36_03090 [Methylocystis sp.]